MPYTRISKYYVRLSVPTMVNMPGCGSWLSKFFEERIASIFRVIHATINRFNMFQYTPCYRLTWDLWGECWKSWNRWQPPSKFVPIHYVWSSTFLIRRLRALCSCTNFENTLTQTGKLRPEFLFASCLRDQSKGPFQCPTGSIGS